MRCGPAPRAPCARRRASTPTPSSRDARLTCCAAARACAPRWPRCSNSATAASRCRSCRIRPPLFHNDYDHLRTQEIDPSRSFITFDSLMEGKAHGIEMWGSYQATPSWRLSAGLTALHQDMRLKPGSNDLAGPGNGGQGSVAHDPAALELQHRARQGARGGGAQGGGAGESGGAGIRRAGRALRLAACSPNLGAVGDGAEPEWRHAEYGPASTRSEIRARGGGQAGVGEL